MSQLTATPDPRNIASEIDARIRSLPVRSVPNLRALRREYSRVLRKADGRFVLGVAGELRRRYGHWGVPCELIAAHPGAFRLLGARKLEELGRGVDSWWSVDIFARTLTGPAWLEGMVSDDVTLRWARSPDKWWRRVALVSTVALNMRSQGGRGDAPRTLRVCRLLADDHEDTVEKALSWALRELVVHDAAAVRGFIARYEGRLGARVRREVSNKLRTGLKNPGATRPRR